MKASGNCLKFQLRVSQILGIVHAVRASRCVLSVFELRVLLCITVVAKVTIIGQRFTPADYAYCHSTQPVAFRNSQTVRV